MTNPGDWRETRSPEQAAAETEEPEEPARVRAEDDAATRARQEQAAAGLREADRALEDGGQRLRATRVALDERERERGPRGPERGAPAGAPPPDARRTRESASWLEPVT